MGSSRGVGSLTEARLQSITSCAACDTFATLENMNRQSQVPDGTGVTNGASTKVQNESEYLGRCYKGACEELET